MFQTKLKSVALTYCGIAEPCVFTMGHPVSAQPLGTAARLEHRTRQHALQTGAPKLAAYLSRAVRACSRAQPTRLRIYRSDLSRAVQGEFQNKFTRTLKKNWLNIRILSSGMVLRTAGQRSWVSEERNSTIFRVEEWVLVAWLAYSSILTLPRDDTSLHFRR